MLALAPGLPAPHAPQELPPAHAHRLRTRRAGAVVLVAPRLGAAPPTPGVVGAGGPRGLAGTYRRGLFTVDTSVLDSPYRDAVVAHEMAHSLLGAANELLPAPGAK